MALDYGERRIGVAISDEAGRIAFPHETIDRKPGGLDGAYARIADLVDECDVSSIVVGLPIHMNGRPGPEAEAARKFGEAVHTRTGLPVDYLDERWTTLEADRALKSAGARGKKKKAQLDAAAAAVLLRAYLDRAQA